MISFSRPVVLWFSAPELNHSTGCIVMMSLALFVPLHLLIFQFSPLDRLLCAWIFSPTWTCPGRLYGSGVIIIQYRRCVARTSLLYTRWCFGFRLVAHENWLVRNYIFFFFFFIIIIFKNNHQEKCDFELFQLCSSSSGFYRDERSNTSFLRDQGGEHFLTFDDGYLLFLSPLKDYSAVVSL